MHIAVIGVWHNAFITAACLAQFGHHVTLVNPDEEPWTSFPKLNIHEPGLDELIEHMRLDGRLAFGNLHQPDNGHEATVVWLAIDTPLRDDDSPDVEPLILALDRCTDRFREATLLVIGSQVPVGFCRTVEKRLGVRVACVPENMRLGSGLEDFRAPDRLVIGADGDAGTKCAMLLHRVAAKNTVMCDLPTAEMIKHATNTMLATQISLANELASVGELHGADNHAVAKAMKLDRRIGPYAYVRPGLGFAGGTLPRDLRALQMSGEPLSLIDAVFTVNDSVIARVAKTVAELRPRTACLLGYTYKAETNALRCSPAKTLVEALFFAGRSIEIVGYDPRMNGTSDAELTAINMSGRHQREWSGLEADVYVIVTPLREFRALDWSRHGQGLVYDLCDGVDRKAVLDAGLSYKAIWQPTEKPS